MTGLIERIDKKLKYEMDKIEQYEKLDRELTDNISMVHRHIKDIKTINNN